MRRSRKIRVAIVACVIAALAGGVAAFAYFTSTGSGTGTAKVGSAAPTVTIAGTVAEELYPGGSPAKVALTITNEGASATHVATVSLSETKADATHSGCKGEWFEMAPVSVNKTIASKASASAEGTLTMKNTEENQDPCQGATLTLTFTSD